MMGRMEEMMMGIMRMKMGEHVGDGDGGKDDNGNDAGDEGE